MFLQLVANMFLWFLRLLLLKTESQDYLLGNTNFMDFFLVFLPHFLSCFMLPFLWWPDASLCLLTPALWTSADIVMMNGNCWLDSSLSSHWLGCLFPSPCQWKQYLLTQVKRYSTHLISYTVVLSTAFKGLLVILDFSLGCWKDLHIRIF